MDGQFACQKVHPNYWSVQVGVSLLAIKQSNYVFTTLVLKIDEATIQITQCSQTMFTPYNWLWACSRAVTIRDVGFNQVNTIFELCYVIFQAKNSVESTFTSYAVAKSFTSTNYSSPMW